MSEASHLCITKVNLGSALTRCIPSQVCLNFQIVELAARLLQPSETPALESHYYLLIHVHDIKIASASVHPGPVLLHRDHWGAMMAL